MRQPTPSTGNPEAITRLQAGVAPAFAMLAGMQLEVFTHLAEGPRSAFNLADVLGVSIERLSRLLYALVVSGLLEAQEDRFANTPEAATFLIKGRTGYLGGVHELLSQLWHADLQTAQSIWTGKPAALHDFSAASDEEMAGMLRGMHAGAIGGRRELLRRYDFSQCRSVVDVGGGSGGLVAALCDAHPNLRGTLFELPRTAALGSVTELGATDTPAAKAVIHAGPVAQRVWQVPPRRAGAQDPQHRRDKPAKTRFVALPGVRDALYHQYQRCPAGIVQVRPGHGRVPLEASNTSRVARPATGSRTAIASQFSHRA